jgi:hypothetical protein
MKYGCKYSLNIQSELVSALCCLHTILQGWEHPGHEAYIDPKPPSDSSIYYGKFKQEYGGSKPPRNQKRGDEPPVPVVADGGAEGGNDLLRIVESRLRESSLG